MADDFDPNKIIDLFGVEGAVEEPRPTDLLYHATPVKGPVDFSIGELGAHFSENPDLSRRAMTLLGHKNYSILEAKIDLGNVVTVPEQESFFNAEALVTSLVNQGSISPEQASEAYDSIDQVLEDPAHPAMQRAEQVLEKAHIYDPYRLEKQAETELLRPFLKKWGIDTIRYWNTYDAYGDLGRLKNLPGVNEQLELGTQPAWSYIVVNPERVRSATEYTPGLPDPRPTDKYLPAVIDAAAAASQLPQTPTDEPRPKGKGQMFRGIGSLMRRRLFPIVQGAQLGWETLTPEQRQGARDFLDSPNTLHEFFGMEKPGIEYFKDLLGLSEQEPTGTATLEPGREFDPINIFKTSEERPESIGQVNNQIDERVGRTSISLRPSEFRQLAEEFDPNTKHSADTIQYLEDAIRDSRAIAPPYLTVQWVPEKSAWKVLGHEGRHRVLAGEKVFGDENLPVHLFLRNSSDAGRLGRRIEVDQLSPEMQQALENRRFIPEEGEEIVGFHEPTGMAQGGLVQGPLSVNHASGGFVDKPLYEDARMIG